MEFPESEYTALYDFFNATDGASWNWKKPYATNGNPWTFATQLNPCTDSWQGIVCSVNSSTFHVTQIALASFGLHGSLPSTISNLTELQVLDLVQNHLLVGTLPFSIGDLSNLRRLELSDNNLRGTVPASLSQLQQLQSFQLDANKFNGPFPEFLCGLTVLESLTVSSNHFTGTIPDCIGNLQHLKFLVLDGNLLKGTIPSSIGKLSHLERLSIQHLHLTGTIPAAIGNMSQLLWMYVSYNQLTGTIPDTIYNMSKLYSIGATDNALSGTISPSIAQLVQLNTITLDFNHFTGPLPESLFTIQSLLEVTLNGNAITGTIPEGIGKLPLLDSLDLRSNLLTGTLPTDVWNSTSLVKFLLSNNSLSGTLPNYVAPNNTFYYVVLSTNRFTGTLPRSIASFSQLYELALGDNRFMGSIPSFLGNLSTLEELDLSDNAFTGSIPSTIQYLGALNILSLQGNQLRGRLDNIVSTEQLSLSSIKLDNNEFTGELPVILFQLPALISLSIVGSCLHGTLPPNICDAAKLEALILQGLTTGASCRTAEHAFGGTIPQCLLSMTTLRTLLLSSNSLKGKIEYTNNTIGSTLLQLDLSHNLLTGSIPVSMQNHTWSLLDLSHNKLSGVLSTQLHALQLVYLVGNLTTLTAYPKLALDTNRLSGPVPNTVKQLHSNLSVLAGNLFQCRYDKTDLPQHDSDISTYECASNPFDLSMYTWLGFVLTSAVILCIYLLHGRKNTAQKGSHDSFQNMPNVSSVFDSQSVVNKVSCYATIFCLVVLLPYYAILSLYGGTHAHQYAYVLSAVYTSGVISFTLTLILLALLMCLVWWCIQSTAITMETKEVTALHRGTNKHYLSVCAVYALTNMCMVLGVNILFVYIVLYQSSQAQTVAQVALSVFKLVWSMEVSPYMMRKLDAYCHPEDGAEADKHRHNYFTLQLLVGLFNNIAIPCLVVMAIDPNCFSDVLLPPNTEKVNYIESVCERNLYRGACVRQSYRVATLKYTPPFTYSYQCSASFITSYAPAFVYMSLSNTILHPLLQYTLVRLSNLVSTDGALHQLIFLLLPRLLKPPTDFALDQCQKQGRVLIGASGVLVTLFTQLGILLTFGAIFPPVALAIAVSIASIVYLTRFKVQRFVQAAKDAQLVGYLQVINAECAGVGTREQMQLAVKIIVCYCCAFYTLFLFDALGDAEEFAASVWVLIVIPLTPVCIFGFTYGYDVTLSLNGKVPLDDTQREVELGNFTDAEKEGQIDGVVVVSVLHEPNP